MLCVRVFSAGFNFYGQLGIGNDTLGSVNHFVPMLFPQDVHQLRCVSSQGHFLLFSCAKYDAKFLIFFHIGMDMLVN